MSGQTVVTLSHGFLHRLPGGHVLWGHLAQAEKAGTFLFGVTAFIVSGTKA